MLSLTDRVLEIAKNLAKKIPRPLAKPQKPQKSFAGIQVGQKLRLSQGQCISTPDTGQCSRGTLFKATEATNLGVRLMVVETLNGKTNIGSSLWWTRREWQGTFEKAGRQ